MYVLVVDSETHLNGKENKDLQVESHLWRQENLQSMLT